MRNVLVGTQLFRRTSPRRHPLTYVELRVTHIPFLQILTQRIWWMASLKQQGHMLALVQSQSLLYPRPTHSHTMSIRTHGITYSIPLPLGFSTSRVNLAQALLLLPKSLSAITVVQP